MATKNTIKGLTVEIGGDTTKLGEALKDVDKQTGDLGKELGEINRLLKFDPENTELLAQKQKVLGEMIGATGDRLETLKEAEKQVQEQFAKGEVAESQVRALQREIAEAESKMKYYLEQVRKASKGTGDLGDETKQAKGDLKQYEQAAEDAGEATKDLGDGFTVMKGAMANLVSDGIKGLGSLVKDLATSLVSMAGETREYRTEMGKLDTAFTTNGFSAEAATNAYKELQGVLGESDQAVEAANHLAQLTDNEKDLAKWTGDILPGVFATFGASLPIEGLTEAANETAKVGKVTGPLADALNWAGVSEEAFNEQLALCTTEQQRQALITQTLTELYGEAAQAYKETNAEVIKANQANEAWMATMAEAGAAVDPILTDVKMLGASLLTEFTPGITEAANAVRGLLNGEDGAADMLGSALSGMITQLLEKAVGLLPQLADVAMSLVDALINNFVNSMLPQLLESAIQVFLVVLEAIPVLLEALIPQIGHLAQTVADTLLGNIDLVLASAIQLLLAVVDAIPVLLDTLLPQVSGIVDSVIGALLDNIDLLVNGAVQLFFGILKAIPEITAAVYREMPSIVTSIIDSLLRCIPDLIEAGGQLLGGLIEGMLDFDWMGSISSIGNGIVGGFKKIFDIHSPSRVMAELGEMLDQGLAVGIEENAAAPVNALDALSDDMVDTTAGIDGLNIERRMEHTFVNSSTPAQNGGVMAKLDQIYRAILAGQVIMLDSKTLIGSTAEGYDSELGMRRVLAERGAL